MASKITKNGHARWKARVQRDGAIRQKLFDTKAEALTWESAMRNSPTWEVEEPTTVTQTVTALMWANNYLDAVKDRAMSDKTYGEKKDAFSRFFAVYPKTGELAAITVAHAYAVLRKRAKTVSGHAANKDRKNLSAAWAWGVKYQGLSEKNPFKAVERFGEDKQPRYVPCEEDFWKVYQVAENDQDRIMLLAYLHTAARKSEILNLRWDDVDFSNSRIRLWTKKRQGGAREYDWIPLTKELRDALLRHRQNANSVFVFTRQRGQKYTTRQHWLRYLCGVAEVRYFSLHAIRHLTASILDKAGMDLSTIQAILRHKSATTTARYMHSLRGVRAALDDVFGQGVDMGTPGTKKALRR